MPTVVLPRSSFDGEGWAAADLYVEAALTPSKSEARRLMQQGGAAIAVPGGAERQITDTSARVTAADLDPSGELVLRAGKKKFVRIVTE